MSKVAPPAILDTNVASFILSGRAEAALYEHDLRGRRRLIAFQTEAELLAGADIRGWSGRRRASLTRFLKSVTTVYPTLATSRAYAHHRAALEHVGEPMETADLWIAATALAAGITLIAHDAAFRRSPGCAWSATRRSEAAPAAADRARYALACPCLSLT